MTKWEMTFDGSTTPAQAAEHPAVESLVVYKRWDEVQSKEGGAINQAFLNQIAKTVPFAKPVIVGVSGGRFVPPFVLDRCKTVTGVILPGAPGAVNAIEV